MKKVSVTVQNIDLLRIAIVTVLILLVPFVAMQFTGEVNWKLNDFVVAGVLLFAAGLAINLIIKNVKHNKKRVIVGAVLLLGLMYLWVELAVGVFTNWGS